MALQRRTFLVSGMALVVSQEIGIASVAGQEVGGDVGSLEDAPTESTDADEPMWSDRDTDRWDRPILPALPKSPTLIQLSPTQSRAVSLESEPTSSQRLTASLQASLEDEPDFLSQKLSALQRVQAGLDKLDHEAGRAAASFIGVGSDLLSNVRAMGLSISVADDYDGNTRAAMLRSPAFGDAKTSLVIADERHSRGVQHLDLPGSSKSSWLDVDLSASVGVRFFSRTDRSAAFGEINPQQRDHGVRGVGIFIRTP